MKKLTTLIFALIVILSLAACDKDTTQNQNSKPDNTPSQTQNVTSENDSSGDVIIVDETTEDDETDIGNDVSNENTDVQTPQTNTNEQHTHTYTTTTKTATCTAAGSKTTTCKNCTYSKTETIAKLGHNYESKVTKPTCTAKGYTTHTCSRCKNSYKDNYTDARHNFKISGSTTVTITCTGCNAKLTQTNNKLDHFAISDTAYWKDGKLYVQFMLVNTYDYDITVTAIEGLYFDIMGTNTKLTQTVNLTNVSFVVPANGYYVNTLYFESNMVLNYGTTLKNVGMYCSNIIGSRK